MIRSIIQRCNDPACAYAGDCYTHTYIHDSITVHQAERDPVTLEVIPGSDREITLHNVALEVSHAPTHLHHACRMNGLASGVGHPDVRTEDHTAAEPGHLLANPPIVQWAPRCVDCHHLSGHGEPAHHKRGLGRRDGTLLVHDSHPNYKRLAEVAEAHQGASWRDCERCAGQAATCLGCKASLQRAEGQ